MRGEEKTDKCNGKGGNEEALKGDGHFYRRNYNEDGSRGGAGS